MISIPVTSSEPIEVVWQTDIDPSALTVKAKYQTAGSDAPDTGDAGWVTGTWQTATLLGTGRYSTPAWFTVSGLSVGLYDVWVWIDGTYDPIRKAAQLNIFG